MVRDGHSRVVSMRAGRRMDVHMVVQGDRGEDDEGELCVCALGEAAR